MKFYLSYIQKLSEVIQETSGTENRFLACPSLRVYESSDFDFLSAEEVKPQHRLDGENISMQFNSLSTSNNFWDIDAASSLFDFYKERLSQVQLQTRKGIIDTGSTEDKILYSGDGSPSAALINYTASLDEYEMMLNEHSDFINAIDQNATEKQRTVINRKWDVLQKKLALFVANWKLSANKEEIEQALEKLNKVTDYDAFLALKEIIQSRLIDAELTGIKSSVAFSKVNIFPTDFNKNDLSWSSLEVDYQEVDTIFKRAKSTLKGFNENLLDFDYDENFIEKIIASYCIVTIQRPWLDKSVLESEFILPTGMKKEYTYAKKVLLLKDLRVILKTDLTQEEQIQIDGNSVIKFGPIFMKNQFFKNAISQKTFIKPITSKEIYTKAYAPRINKKIALLSSQLKLQKTDIRPEVSKSVKKQTITETPNTKPNKILRAKVIQHKKSSMLKINPKFLNLQKPISITPKKPLQAIQLSHKTMLAGNLFTAKNLMIYSIPNNNRSNSRVHFNVKDQLGNQPIYKVEVSIKDKLSTYFKEVETDQDGQISILLSESTYEITLRKNGFEEHTFIETIKKNENTSILKKLSPKEVRYDSYFLVGIIGDQVIL